MDGASAPVQIDKTGEAMAEMQREIADYASGKAPATRDEVEGMEKVLTLQPARCVRDRRAR